MHDKGIVHADIKPANLMSKIDGSDTVLIEAIDFGLSHKLPLGQDSITTYAGGCTPFYMAPEINQGIYSFSSDVYALGVIFTHDLLMSDPKFDAMLHTSRHLRPTLSELITHLENKIYNKQTPPPCIAHSIYQAPTQNQFFFEKRNIKSQDFLIPNFDNQEAFFNFAQERRQKIAEKAATAAAQKEAERLKREARLEKDRHAIQELRERIIQAELEAMKRKVRERAHAIKKNITQRQEEKEMLIQNEKQAKNQLTQAEQKTKPFFSTCTNMNSSDYSYLIDECEARIKHIKAHISLLEFKIAQHNLYVSYHEEFPMIFKKQPCTEKKSKLELALQQAKNEEQQAKQHALLFSYWYTPENELRYFSTTTPESITDDTICYLFNAIKLNLYQKIHARNLSENHAYILEKNVKKIISSYLIDLEEFNTDSNSLVRTSEVFITELKNKCEQRIACLWSTVYPAEIKDKIKFLLNQELEKCLQEQKLSDFEREIRHIVTKYRATNIPLEIVDNVTLETDFNKMKAYYEQNFSKPRYIFGEYWDRFNHRDSLLKTELIYAMKKIPFAFFEKNGINLNNLEIILSTDNIVSFSQANFEQAIGVLQTAYAVHQVKLAKPFEETSNLFYPGINSTTILKNASIKVQAAYIDKIIHTDLKNLSKENLKLLHSTLKKLKFFNFEPLIDSQIHFLLADIKKIIKPGMDVEKSTISQPILFANAQQKKIIRQIIQEKNKKDRGKFIERGIKKERNTSCSGSSNLPR